MTDTIKQKDIYSIMKLLPHRYPFILVDRVDAFEAETSITAIKNVTINEPFFQGHFPGFPVMPGVLILESMAQATALLAFYSMLEKGMELSDNKVFLFAGVDKVRFKRQVIPGDQLRIEIILGPSKQSIWKASAKAYVGDQLACTAELLAAYREVGRD